MSLLRRSASSWMTLGERVQPLVLGDRRRLREHRRGAENGRQRRTQLVRHRTDQRFAQQFGFGAHLCFVERARDVETLERGGGVRQHLVDAAGASRRHHSAGTPPRSMAITPKSGVRSRDAAHEPGVAAVVVDRGSENRSALDIGDGGAHLFGHGRVPFGLAVACLRAEQHDLAAAPGWRHIPRSRDRFPPPKAPPRAVARRHRDRSSRSRACARARSAASSSWRDGSSPARRS